MKLKGNYLNVFRDFKTTTAFEYSRQFGLFATRLRSSGVLNKIQMDCMESSFINDDEYKTVQVMYDHIWIIYLSFILCLLIVMILFLNEMHFKKLIKI